MLGGILTLAVGFTACTVAVNLPPEFFPRTITNTTLPPNCEDEYCF
jgi:hypothetical protein